MHGYFTISDSKYIDSFYTEKSCMIYLSKINISDFSEEGCSPQIILIQASFVKLFIGLGVSLVGAGSFLIYSGIDKKERIVELFLKIEVN